MTMSFETELLFKSLVAPLAVSSIVVWIWVRYARDISKTILKRPILVGLAWWLASLIVLAFQSQSLRFDETWQQADYLLWILALAACVSTRGSKATGKWLLAAFLVVMVLYASLPRGDGWDDMATTKHVWWAMGVLAWIANSWFWPLGVREEDRLFNGQLIWTLVLYQTALAICALSCYGSLGEWSLSLIAITIPFALLASRKDLLATRPLLSQVYAAGSLVAISAVLYGCDPWAVGIALFMPAIVGVLDCWSQRLALSRMPKIWISVVGSSLTLLVVIILLGRTA